MTRRRVLVFFPVFFPLLTPCLAVEPSKTRLRGKLLRGRRMRSAAGVEYALTGDAATLLVLDDQRLWDSEFEAEGVDTSKSPAAPSFAINPIHLKPMFVFESGDRLGVSYWCDICYIRTYSPGQCWCCQEETRLDPKDPATPDRKP